VLPAVESIYVPWNDWVPILSLCWLAGSTTKMPFEKGPFAEPLVVVVFHLSFPIFSFFPPKLVFYLVGYII
jgi:hypothetical protein